MQGDIGQALLVGGAAKGLAGLAELYQLWAAQSSAPQHALPEAP